MSEEIRMRLREAAINDPAAALALADCLEESFSDNPVAMRQAELIRLGHSIVSDLDPLNERTRVGSHTKPTEKELIAFDLGIPVNQLPEIHLKTHNGLANTLTVYPYENRIKEIATILEKHPDIKSKITRIVAKGGTLKELSLLSKNIGSLSDNLQAFIFDSVCLIPLRALTKLLNSESICNVRELRFKGTVDDQICGAVACAQLPNLEILELNAPGYNFINYEGINDERLKKIIKEKTKIQELYIKNNKLTHKGINALARSELKLTKLAIGGNNNTNDKPLISNAIKRLLMSPVTDGVVHLDMSKLFYAATGIVEGLNASDYLEKLVSLNISQSISCPNSIETKPELNLDQEKFSQLRLLDISFNNIVSENLETQLATPRCINLRVLKATNVFMSLFVLGALISNHDNMERLDINRISSQRDREIVAEIAERLGYSTNGDADIFLRPPLHERGHSKSGGDITDEVNYKPPTFDELEARRLVKGKHTGRLHRNTQLESAAGFGII